MATFLFDEIIFGPVNSRRLGVSLGINLLPSDRKICTFNCIYCECGWTKRSLSGAHLPSREEVKLALEHKLSEMKASGDRPDVITYAGNGEPTLHPEFPGIIDDSILIRDRFFPGTRIAVLSNSTTISKPEIKAALLKVDENILKLDSAFDSTITILNQPKLPVSASALIDELASFGGRLIIQTLFIRGSYQGSLIDNTSEKELDAWLLALKKINPSMVMIYTISRDTPDGSYLHKIPLNELNEIASRVEKSGLRTQVSG